jgi:hypothetical protein
MLNCFSTGNPSAKSKLEHCAYQTNVLHAFVEQSDDRTIDLYNPDRRPQRRLATAGYRSIANDRTQLHSTETYPFLPLFMPIRWAPNCHGTPGRPRPKSPRSDAEHCEEAGSRRRRRRQRAVEGGWVAAASGLHDDRLFLGGVKFFYSFLGIYVT